LRKEEVNEMNENALPGREAEAEEYWFDGPTALGDVRITRTQAIKLAGLGGAGFLFTLLLPDTADARKRRRRRRRRKAQVTPNPVVVVPGTPVQLSITNPSGEPLTISRIQLVGSDGTVLSPNILDGPVRIPANDTDPDVRITVPLGLDPTLVNASHNGRRRERRHCGGHRRRPALTSRSSCSEADLCEPGPTRVPALLIAFIYELPTRSIFSEPIFSGSHPYPIGPGEPCNSRRP
jgi:hypothetical protein